MVPMATRRSAVPGPSEQLELFPPRGYLNIDQVAELLGVPKSFIYRRTARGHDDPIPHYRLGGHLRFKLIDVEAWVEAHRSEAEKPNPIALVAAQRQRGKSRTSQRVIRRTPTHE